MNLLIVDDQIKVVEGLKKINWAQYGISGVFGAFSVATAIEIFNSNKIDILLCDIEMPVESGLSLINWVQKKELDTKCILLTAHAKFDYAQQSIKLRVFDYILQPASYEHIISIVKKAIDSLNNEREQTYLKDLGDAFNSSKNTAISSVLRNYLLDSAGTDELQFYANLGKFPTQQSNCMLCCVQMLRWTMINEWTPALLSYAFENIMGDLFSSFNFKSIVSPIDKTNYAVLLWNDNESEQQTIIGQQLNFFKSICQEKIGSVVAIYWCDNITMEHLPQKWDSLVSMQMDNISRESDVFLLSENTVKQDGPKDLSISKSSTWAQMLCTGYAKAVEIEAFELLDEMCVSGTQSARALRVFHQEFLHSFYTALNSANSSARETLSNEENLKIFNEATHSIEQLKTFVQFAVSLFPSQESSQDKDFLRKLDEYIDANIETEISRKSISEHMFLNADYLNRLIKKNTGFSLKEYASQRKLQHAKMLLSTTQLPVSIIACKVGYGNAAHFSVVYKKMFNVTPMQTRHESLK